MAIAVAVLALLAVSCGSSSGTTGGETSVDRAPDATVPEPSVPPAVDPPVTSGPAGAAEPASVEPEGFASVAAVVTDAAGERCDVCLWVADTRPDRARGLMGVTDLGGRDGMAFVYDRPTSTSFTMRNTVLPLSIVFYGADGAYLDAFDMTPCIDEPCPSYPTPDGFTAAIEVLQGGATGLGMEPGSRLELLGTPCP